MKQVRGKDTIVDASLREVKAHGTEGFPFAVYLNDFSSFQNEGICWHWHDEAQITLIVEGEFLCQAGGEKIVMGPGEIIFFNSCALHQIIPRKKAFGTLYSFLWKPELLSGMGTDVYQNCVLPVLNSPLKYFYFGAEHPQNKHLQLVLRRLIRIMLEKERFYELRAYGQIAGVWLQICEYTESSLLRDPKAGARYLAELKDEEKVKNALVYIEEHYAEKVTLESIAQAALTNRSELCKCFRRVLDTTPNEFLTQYRINRSLLLLENTQMRIVEIAEATGFCSPSHFGTNFMKQMGCTPLQYRKHTLQ